MFFIIQSGVYGKKDLRIFRGKFLFNFTLFPSQYEELAQEHEQLKERCEEVSLELEILKNEISEGGKIKTKTKSELENQANYH